MATLPKGRMTSRSNHGLDQDKQGEGDGGCCARTRADQAEAADLTHEATAGGDKARPSEPGKEAAARTHHDGEGNRAGLHQELAVRIANSCEDLKPQKAVLGVIISEAPAVPQQLRPEAGRGIKGAGDPHLEAGAVLCCHEGC